MKVEEERDETIEKLKTENESSIEFMKKQLVTTQAESAQKTDSMNDLKGQIDSLGEETITLREELNKERNEKDCQKQMLESTQMLMEKHETENTQLAEKLVVMKS